MTSVFRAVYAKESECRQMKEGRRQIEFEKRDIMQIWNAKPLRRRQGKKERKKEMSIFSFASRTSVDERRHRQRERK